MRPEQQEGTRHSETLGSDLPGTAHSLARPWSGGCLSPPARREVDEPRSYEPEIRSCRT